nr:DNA replication ATP-dependent helicase/nuclease DNA2 [Onthophagus taurus]
MIDSEEDMVPATPEIKSRKIKVKVLSPKNENEHIDNKKRTISPSCSNHNLEKKFKKAQIENADPLTIHKCLEKSPILTKRWPAKSSPRKSPKKISPKKARSPKKKLFETTHDVNMFKVEVIDNFVKVTPSKSSCAPSLSPKKRSSEKKQSSILQYTSPSLSSRFQTEMKTPPQEKTPSKNITPSMSRVKVKLHFEKLNCDDLIEKNLKIEVKNEYMELMGDDFSDFFENDVDLKLPEEIYSLDLSQPQHCKVLSFNKIDKNKMEIIVKSTKSDEKAKCVLEGFWIHTNFDVKAEIYLQGIKLNNEPFWRVTNKEGLLVYEPNLLISSTSVVGALFCKRRAVFRTYFAGFEPENKVMIIGVLVHSLLQNVLKSKANTLRQIETILKALLTTKDSVKMLYRTSLTLEEIKEEISTFIPRILKFIQVYFFDKTDTNINNWKGHIDSIKDIEENIWCPELGMKGKIDVTLKIDDEKMMPLEIKTGRTTVSLEHRGQVMIYIMMMLKLGYNVSSGLLLYLKEGDLKEIKINESEKRDIILLRNDLAYFLKQRVQLKRNDKDEKTLESMKLPEPIHHHSACGKCPYNIICCAYLSKENYDLSSNVSLKEVSKSVLSHLSESHINYFIHWTNLLDLESSQHVHKDISSIYTILPEEREKQGKCLSNLNLIGCIADADGFYKHTFKKITETTTLLISGLNESSYVVISTNERPAVASGLVTYIDHTTIIVELERNLQDRYKNSPFHIDSYDSTSANSFNLSNLALLLEDTETSQRLRDLIIDKKPPNYLKKLPRIVATKAPPILQRLNAVQQQAVLKVLTAEDYVLIKGLPGTGKTATIVALVELLTEIGKSVLITSYTHNAVDNVCLRLKRRGVKVLRLGSQGRIHSDLIDMSEFELTKNCQSVEELEKVYNEAKVLAVTCLGSKHPVLSKRTLDVCLIDESTQALQCSLFRALSVCKKYVFIGDPNQLPPLVKSEDARLKGMSETVFDRLQSDVGMVTLNINYRMNATITDIANKFMYDGELKIGKDSISNATLNFDTSIHNITKKKWILETLSTKLKDSVKILDTGKTHLLNYNFNFSEKLSSNDELKCSNLYETAIIYKLIKILLKLGIPYSNVGVIAPYRAQVAQLSSVLVETKIDVSTVDQFQGQDKSVIIYSCTKSTPDLKITKFDILEDKRRLNVALTRAKHKLIIIGDVETVGKYSTFGKLFKFVDSDNFIRLENGNLDFDWGEVADLKLE